MEEKRFKIQKVLFLWKIRYRVYKRGAECFGFLRRKKRTIWRVLDDNGIPVFYEGPFPQVPANFNSEWQAKKFIKKIIEEEKSKDIYI